jgi:fatty acid CoA ligase FadD22
MTPPEPGNLAAALEAAAAGSGWEERPAFLVGDRVFTHGQVHDGAARAATLLTERGVGRGDRVLLVLPDGIEFVWSFLGAVRLGALAVPVNPRLTPGDHRQMLEAVGAAVVLAAGGAAEPFAGRAAVVEAEGLEASLEGRAPHPVVDVGPDDPAYAQFTSGTTGLPKAAVHRHGDPPVYHEAFARPALEIGPDDVSLSVSKMFFAYGLGNSLFFTLLAGCRAVLHPGAPRPDDIAVLVRRHRVSLLFTVPTLYARLSTCADRSTWGSLRAAVSAGETLTPALAERVRDTLGCPVLDGLGSTEVGQTFVSNTLAEQRDGTIGRALPPYEVAVRAPSGEDLPPREMGTLWVRGPTLLLEYLGRPEATAAVKVGDWLCTGDRAVIEPDGFVRHQGRVDDMEIVGGVNIGPLEIEALLAGHPAVTEVAVAGVRDELGASRLEAFVVLAPGAASPDQVADELVGLARERLAPHKVPRAVRFVDTLPRTPTGKLRRFVLRSGEWPAQGERG